MRSGLTGQGASALLALLLLALLPRLLVPAGFMPMAERGRVVMLPCLGAATMATPHRHHGRGDDGKTETSPCPFAAAAQPVTGGAPPPLLAAAILFVLALGLARRPASPPGAPARLRPPLRAPPR